MYLHEFQAKNILKDNNILVPKSFLLNNINQINDVLNFFNSDNLILKAQIHSGARGKFGGILPVKKTYTELLNKISQLLGATLITNQSGSEGKIVNKILIEECIDIKEEIYISLSVDRDNEEIVMLVSSSGGIDIENVGDSRFLKLNINLLLGLCDYQIREVLYFLNFKNNYFLKLKQFFFFLFSIFLSNDLSLLEINPLVIFNDNLLCLDAKFECDDNALYRNKKIEALYDFSQENTVEIEAKKYGLSYISLGGTIGCMVNGAGLAMATMDLIKLHDGNPANFLDIGGDATEDHVFQAIRVILMDDNINCIFVNIFGGIVRCDLIANSMLTAFKKLNVTIPIVVRLIGHMSDNALHIIRKSKFDIHIESDFMVAIKKIVSLSKGAV